MYMRCLSIPIIIAVMATHAWAAPMTSTDKIVKTFMELDANHSQGVSLDEYRAMVDQRMRARFKEMDGNRDGQVSDDEYRAFWVSTKAQWYRLER